MATARQRKTNYLWDRPNTDVVWFSRAVPKALWGVEGKKVIQFSLGTSNRRKAEATARAHASELDARWGLLTPPSASPTDLSQLAVDHAYRGLVTSLDANRRASPNRHSVEYVERRERDKARIGLDLLDGDLSKFEPHADRFLANHQIELDRTSPEYAAFVRNVGEAFHDALDVTTRQLRGELDAEPRSKAVRAVLEREASTAPAGETIMELFDAYAAATLARSNKRADTLAQDRKIVAGFAAFVGEQRAVKSIERADARDYRNAISKLPANMRKKNRYLGMGIREASALAEKIGDAVLSPITVNKYLSTVSPFFQWLVRESYVDANPFNGFHLDISRDERRENSHPPFSIDQLNKILGSPLFSGFARDGKEWVSGNVHADDWRHWIPLICLFSGARIGEIAQLNVLDIQKVQSVWVMHLREEKGTGQQTKSRKTRVVPLHSVLIALGFLRFHAAQVERSQRDKNSQLFPELKPNDRGQIGHLPSRWWRKYLTNIGLKDGADRFGAHSFRATISDEFRKSDVRNHDFGPLILGHSNASTTEGYGILSEGTPKRLSEIMELAKFEGVDFGKLVQHAGTASNLSKP